MKRLLLLAFAGLSLHTSVNAQVTVTYPQRTANYYGNFTSGTAGSFDQGSYQLGMYANTSGAKQVVRWRKFRTDAGTGSTSDRAMQVGDVFSVTLSACRAYGRIGFALLSSPSSVTSWADRENNYALSINLDGPLYAGTNTWGAWYTKYANGSTSTGDALLYGQQGPTYKDFTFTVTLLAPDRANVTMTSGSTTSYLFDVQLNSSSPITDYSVFLEDDWDGSSSRNVYWGLGALGNQHALYNGGDVPFGSSNSNFTVSTAIADGLVSSSSSTASVNTLKKNGTGTMTLTGANTYTGTTTVNGGSLVLARSGGSTIPSTNDVVVNNGGNLKISSSQTIRNLTVNSGGTVTVDAGVTLTISGTATINASGAFNGTGTVAMSGTSIMQINSGGWPGNTNAFTWSSSATLKFPNSGSSYGVNSTDTYWTSSSYPGNIEVGTVGITLNAARSALSAITLNGTLTLAGNSLNLLGGSSLTLNTGSSVTGSGIVLYNNTCNLIYNQGGSVTTGQEWANNITGTTVTIKNNTALSFGASTVARSMGGSLNINSGSSLTLSSAAGGDLSLYGSITNAGTFNTNGRTLTFLTNNVSTYSKTGGGTDNIDKLVVNTAANKSLSIDAGTTLNIVSSLVLTNGNINLWGGSSSPTVLIIGAGASISGAGGITINGGNSYNSVKFAGSSSINTTGALTITGATLSLSNSASAVTLSSTLSHSGPLVLSAGSFTLGSSVALSLGGSITRGTGVLNAAAGTLTLNGSSAQSIPAGTFSGNIANLVLNNSNGVTISDNATVTGVLTLTAGSLSMGGNTLTIASGASITRSAGTLAAAPSFAGSSVDVTYNGSSNITTGYELPSTNILRNVTLNGTGDVKLDKVITINGTLTLTSGKLDLDAYDLTMGNGSISGGSSSSYIKTSGSGALTIKNVGATPVAFPVGNSTYNPLDISNPVTLDWSVKVADAISNVTAAYSANVPKAVSRQWDITPSQNSPAPGGGASITFYYNGTTDVGASFSNATTMQVWHYYQGYWAARGSAVAPSTVNGMKAVTVSGLTYFSPYALSNANAPLPVTFLSFTGKRVGTVNELKWTTASESNNRGFVVERSLDGVTFSQVGFVASRAQGGNSTTDISYSYSDASASGTKWHYRLKQVDLDGRAKYSSVVLLKGDKSATLTLEGVYPNPVQSVANIRLQASAGGGNVVLQLSDIQGRIVRTQSVATEAGASATVSLELKGLAAGTYHLAAVDAQGNVSAVVKVVKQ